MKFKKIISAAVGSAVLCSSLPTGTVVNFAEDTLKANAADYIMTTTEPYYYHSTTESYYYDSEEASKSDSWEAVEETTRSWSEDATEEASWAEDASETPTDSTKVAWEETTYPYWWEETATTAAWEETTTEKTISLGDVNGDDCIDSKDAVEVLRFYSNKLLGKDYSFHYYEHNSLSYYHSIDASIGDVNSDGAVNSKDAVLILEYFAEYLATGRSSFDDIVSKVPDTDLPTTSAEITIGTVTVKDGYKVNVPVTISNNSGFAGGGIVFNFNKKELGFNGVTGDIVGCPVEDENNNSVSVTFAGSENMEDNGIIFTLHFILPVNAKAGDVFNISGSIDTFCDEYGRNLPVKITNGAVKIDESYMTDKNVTYNHVNDNETVIEIGNVMVSKEDAGKEVKVPIRIFNNPGFAWTGIRYTFDSRMTFSNIERILIGNLVKSAGNVVAVTSATSSDLTVDGVFYYLNFKLPENAKSGDIYNISAEMVHLTNADAKDIKVESYGGSITIVGDSEPLKATVKTNELEVGKKTTIEANQDNLTYKTSDSNVAVVSKSGEITAISAGTALITVINSDGETDQIVITVKGLSLETTTTTTETESLGDLNNDGRIDSKDAVIVLKSYAEKLAGNETKDDTSAGDVNGDGKVDSKDAVIILKYYASVIAGVFTGNISDFK